MRRRVVFSILGTTLDIGVQAKRWYRWRPTVAMCQQDGLFIDRLELLHSPASASLAQQIIKDIGEISPATEVRTHIVEMKNPWDFAEVYTELHHFAAGYSFDQEEEDYLVNITTGTHVAQICWFLLAEARTLPARLLQLSPPVDRRGGADVRGTHSIIDLDLSRYDVIARRFAEEQQAATSFLKSGIQTRNNGFNRMIDEIEKVAIRSRAPVLLTGPTGAGKSQLAKRIYELKKLQHQVTGPLVEVNCATLRGDQAMSTLFGHVKGAFTGALTSRAGLMKAADKGLLFLDEIGELGADEQAMCLRAIEEKRFLPVGSDNDVRSDFQLIAGTNRNLRQEVTKGTFREDLLARLNLWTFELPALKDRREDIEPNLDFELNRYSKAEGRTATFNKEARQLFISFAMSPEAIWPGNFRDLSASIMRMATLAPQARIDEATVKNETARLKRLWSTEQRGNATAIIEELLGAQRAGAIDLFDQAQLTRVIEECRRHNTISEASRALFSVSRIKKKSNNDADRLRKYLARFDMTFEMIKAYPEKCVAVFGQDMR